MFGASCLISRNLEGVGGRVWMCTGRSYDVSQDVKPLGTRRPGVRQCHQAQPQGCTYMAFIYPMLAEERVLLYGLSRTS
jgi:hypothetical protein